MKPLPHLSPDAREVVLAMEGYDAEFVPYVRTLARNVGLPVERVRQILRQLGEMHLATHGPLLNPDTSAPAGSSWWLTQRGLELQASLNSTKSAHPDADLPNPAHPEEGLPLPAHPEEGLSMSKARLEGLEGRDAKPQPEQAQ